VSNPKNETADFTDFRRFFKKRGNARVVRETKNAKGTREIKTAAVYLTRDYTGK